MERLSEEDIEARIERLDAGWSREGETISREWHLEDFQAAIAFVNRVASLAEAAYHHPDILVHGWNRVKLTLTTHSENGLTDSDFALATQIDTAA